MIRHDGLGLKRLSFGAVGFAAIATLGLTLAGCGNKDDEDDGAAPPPATTMAPTPAATPAPTPTPAATTEVMPEGTNPAGAGRVKAELENRADGITGQPMAAAGARATVQAATGWAITPGPIVVAKSADERGRLAATAFTGDPMAKVNEAATAAGLTGCTWSPPEQLTNVGKDKLAATAADGSCMRGGVKTAAAFMALPAEGTVVVGGWDDPSGDAANVFGGMRAVAKAGGGGDPTGIRACCQALSQNAKSAPPHQQGAYIAAAGLCNSMISNPQGKAALGQVRAMLLGAGVPAACR